MNAPVADRSRLVVGTVRHRRHRPRANDFQHRVWWVLLDVDHLDRAAAGVRGFRVGRRGPVGFRAEDHFGDTDLPLRETVARWVAGQGGRLPEGPLLVWAYPRVLGHVFNPVSWWFAHHPDGTLGLVIAEVRNTFGDWRAYLLDDLAVDGRVVRATHDKDFHVSPFLPIDGLSYRFTLRAPDLTAPDLGGTIAVGMDVDDPDGLILDATQAGRLRPLTTASLWGAMVRHPLVTLWTVALIHAHALRLWWRRTPFHRRPAPPRTGLEGVAPARRGGDSEPVAEPSTTTDDAQQEMPA